MGFIKQIKNFLAPILAAAQRRSPVDGDIVSNSFAYVKGRIFDRWIDLVNGNVRDNGHDINDLIECPAYIIESLLRDENFVERDLQIGTVTDTTHIIVTGLKSSVDNYYNNSYYYNVTRDWFSGISDYVGSTQTLVLDDADTGATAADNILILNIQGDNKIDITSFDAVGNTTNGTRKDWVFAQSFTEKRDIRDVFDELCFESHCELLESVNPDSGINQFKLIALDAATGDTWTNPAYSDGLEQVKIQFTPLESIFTQFRLRYFFDYGKGDYIKEIYVDKNGFPTTATVLSATEQGLCADAETNYKVSQLFEYSSKNIYDDTTAELMLQKKIQWFTKQRMIVNYVTPIVGNSDYIKYEIGDQVKLNFSKGIPTGINNTSMFMITSKRITPLIGGGYITWELIDMGELPS
jgi:hypothetical protein